MKLILKGFGTIVNLVVAWLASSRFMGYLNSYEIFRKGYIAPILVVVAGIIVFCLCTIPCRIRK